MNAKTLGLALLLAAGAHAAPTPADLDPIDCGQCAQWNRPHPPFKLHGGAHYIGPEGISVVAIDTGAGLILLDGALPQSVEQIGANLKSLGREIGDVKYIGISHPHFDHVGGLAALARLSGATVVATAQAAAALKLGAAAADDPQAGFGDETRFAKLGAVRVLADGERITLGDTTLTMHATPGHTPGGSSWTWRECEGETCVDLVYADSLTAVSHDDFRFSADPPRVAAFRHTIARVRAFDCDLLVTAHPSASQLFERAADGKLVDAGACRQLADRAEGQLDQRLREEAGTTAKD